jgi:hypothetical protein
MHELGHTLGWFSSNVPGVDIGPLNIDGDRSDRTTILDYLIWRFFYKNYRSVMNYGYVYNMIGYSDGSHGRNDNDDWVLMSLTFFQE